MLVHSHTYFLMTAASNLDWQETERLNKKTALQSLLTAPEYALVTQPYVLTLLAMVWIFEISEQLPFNSSFLCPDYCTAFYSRLDGLQALCKYNDGSRRACHAGIPWQETAALRRRRCFQYHPPHPNLAGGDNNCSLCKRFPSLFCMDRRNGVLGSSGN